LWALIPIALIATGIFPLDPLMLFLVVSAFIWGAFTGTRILPAVLSRSKSGSTAGSGSAGAPTQAPEVMEAPDAMASAHDRSASRGEDRVE